MAEKSGQPQKYTPYRLVARHDSPEELAAMEGDGSAAGILERLKAQVEEDLRSPKSPPPESESAPAPKSPAPADDDDNDVSCYPEAYVRLVEAFMAKGKADLVQSVYELVDAEAAHKCERMRFELEIIAQEVWAYGVNLLRVEGELDSILKRLGPEKGRG